MDNKYELTITIVNANGDKKNATVADPFGDDDKKDKTQTKIEKFTKTTLKSVAARTSVAVVQSYTQTLGNSTLNEQIELIEQGINFATQTAVAGAAFGLAGVAMSLLAALPNLISKAISYNNGKTWDNLSTNKNIRRAGVEFNRSRMQ